MATGRIILKAENAKLYWVFKGSHGFFWSLESSDRLLAGAINQCSNQQEQPLETALILPILYYKLGRRRRPCPGVAIQDTAATLHLPQNTETFGSLFLSPVKKLLLLLEVLPWVSLQTTHT